MSVYYYSIYYSNYVDVECGSIIHLVIIIIGIDFIIPTKLSKLEKIY